MIYKKIIIHVPDNYGFEDNYWVSSPVESENYSNALSLVENALENKTFLQIPCGVGEVIIPYNVLNNCIIDIQTCEPPN